MILQIPYSLEFSGFLISNLIAADFKMIIMRKKTYQKQSLRGVLWKKVFLEISQNSQESTCARVPFLIKLQVFSSEFCEIFKNTFFYRTPLVAVSDHSHKKQIVRKHGPNWPFYTVMLRTKLY